MTGWLAVASRRGAIVLFLAAGLCSCRKQNVGSDESRPGSDARAGIAKGDVPSAPADGRALAATMPSDAGGLVAATRRACRVMALRGTASATPRFPRSAGQGEERALARGDLVPEGSLIELGAESELTVQATVSTREITLVGPALAEVCPGGDEAVRLTHGKVTGFPGAGVRPGADVWIATPLGVVRFSDAKIDVNVPDRSASRLEVALVSGQANVIPAASVMTLAPSEARADAGRRGRPAPAADGSSVAAIGGNPAAAGDALALIPGVAFEARRRETPVSRWSGDLVAACVRQAGVARDTAQSVTSPRDGGRGALGDLIFAHVRARQQARAACEVAWAAGGLATGLLDAARRADLESAEASWKGTPAPPLHP